MDHRRGYYGWLDRMSSGLCENATHRHSRDLERLGQRAKTEWQLQEILTDLKDRIARKAAVRTQLVFADQIVELTDQAA
jgi:hypothetical protein